MAYVNVANLAGADPTDPEGLAPIRSRNDQPQTIAAFSSSVTPSLSEYRYWARLKRQTEKDGTSLNGYDKDGNIIAAHNPWAFLAKRSKQSDINPVVTERAVAGGVSHEKNGFVDSEKAKSDGVVISEEAAENQFAGMTAQEQENALLRRQLRVASWSMMFFLITTDILGPFNAPYAIANMGLIPGILCYVFFGFIASGTGFICGHLFCKLDSDRFPIRTFGDIAQRVAGPWFRIICSVLQSIQLVVNVGLICLSSGQSLYQVAHNHPCFSVAVVIWALIGMFVGQIRSLRNFSLIAQSSVFLNLFIIVLSMAVIAHSEPNKAVANAANDTLGYGPVVVTNFASNNLVAQINGMFNLVFAYGGAMIFPEMISEMRKPMDFWKGMICADSLIMICYLFYGVFFYCFAGQYTQANAFQGLSPYWAQTVCNVLNMISGMIAACLYGNIGVKVIYVNIVQDIFKGPQINSKKGRKLWTIMIPLYWSIAFVIANSIPALGAMTGLIGAVCIFQFSYTFPPLLLLIYKLRVHAGAEDTPYIGPGSHVTKKREGRFSRAIFGTYREDEEGATELPSKVQRMGRSASLMLLFKIFLLGLSLACFACMGLGMYGTGEAIKQAFAVGQATAFGCKANA